MRWPGSDRLKKITPNVNIDSGMIMQSIDNMVKILGDERANADKRKEHCVAEIERARLPWTLRRRVG